MNIAQAIGFLFIMITRIIEVFGQSYQNHKEVCPGYWNKQRCEDCYDPNALCPTSSSTLSSCKSGYYLTTINSIHICEKCPNDCDSCFESQIGMNLICSTCNDNRVLISGTCQEIKNCEIMNLTLGSCIKCKDGYYMDKLNQCLQCHPSCLTCNEGNVCNQCVNGYSFLDKLFTCTQCDQYTKSKHCKTCSQSEQSTYECSSCLDKYYYNSTKDQCESCPDFCQNCIQQSNDLKCISCQVDSDILQNISGKCLSCKASIRDCEQCALIKDEIKCISCKRTFFYNSDTNSCEQCPDKSVCNCLKSNCDHTSVTIVQCPQNMNLINNMCIINNISNCAILKIDGSCDICAQNFSLENNSCIQKDENKGCRVLDSMINQCKLCKDSHFLYQNKCYGFISNCISQKVPEKCELCDANFYNEDGNCIECKKDPSDCNYLEIEGNKETCNDQSHKTGCPEFNVKEVGCLIWEKGTRNCARCYNKGGYYLNSTLKKCGRVQDECLKVKPGTTECILCKVDQNNYYVVNNGVCVNCADKNSGYYKCQEFYEKLIKATTSPTSSEQHLMILFPYFQLLFILFFTTIF